MKIPQVRQFTDTSEKVTRERTDHPGVEPRDLRKHPASGSRRVAQRTPLRGRATQDARG